MITNAQREILDIFIALEPSDLNAWERSFLTSIGARYRRYGSRTLLSARQWAKINQVSDKFDAPKPKPKPKKKKIKHWTEVLGVILPVTRKQITTAYKRKAFTCHPDRGGDHKAMIELNNAKDQALISIGWGS